MASLAERGDRLWLFVRTCFLLNYVSCFALIDTDSLACSALTSFRSHSHTFSLHRPLCRIVLHFDLLPPFRRPPSPHLRSPANSAFCSDGLSPRINTTSPRTSLPICRPLTLRRPPPSIVSLKPRSLNSSSPDFLASFDSDLLPRTRRPAPPVPHCDPSGLRSTRSIVAIYSSVRALALHANLIQSKLN
jgi:hypothetical protein